jgi:predicted phage terminase large subunit-like protein
MIYHLFDFCDRRAAEERTAFRSFPYIRVLCDAVEACVTGNLPENKKNLLICIPPRHYKTTIVSQSFPAWALGELGEDCEFILTSATAILAVSNAMAIRRIIGAPWYKELYEKVQIDKESKDVQNYFKTTSQGAVYAAGLGGQITGFGAGKVRPGFGGAIIIDDPLKAEDVQSRVMIDKCHRYYTQVLKSRRNNASDTPIILIMQRLHLDDLAGFVMASEPDWHMVQFPAYDEATNTILNPLTTSIEELQTLKEVDPGTYFAQYQQSPIIEGGNIIKGEWWRTYEASTSTASASGIIFITADTAYKEEKHNDCSVLQAWLGTKAGMYMLDGIAGRWNFPTLLQKANEFWHKWQQNGAREFWIEDKASGTPLEQTLNAAGIPAMPWNPRKFHYPDDKVARMRSASWAVHGGKVFLPRGAERAQVKPGQYIEVTRPAKQLIEEASIFAADMTHTHDDHCDAFTMAHSLWVDAGGIL